MTPRKTYDDYKGEPVDVYDPDFEKSAEKSDPRKKTSNMKKILLLSIIIIFIVFVLPNTTIAQTDPILNCKPQEITKQKFRDMTDKILTYPPVDKNIEKLLSNINCVIYITNDFDSKYLSGFVFYLDSNYRINRGFFMKFTSLDTEMQHLIPLKKKQLQKFSTLRIDTSQNQFLYCRTSTLHEKWEILISLNKNQLNSGLYFIGSRLLTINLNEKSPGLTSFREEIKSIKIPKER